MACSWPPRCTAWPTSGGTPRAPDVRPANSLWPRVASSSQWALAHPPRPRSVRPLPAASRRTPRQFLMVRRELTQLSGRLRIEIREPLTVLAHACPRLRLGLPPKLCAIDVRRFASAAYRSASAVKCAAEARIIARLRPLDELLHFTAARRMIYPGRLSSPRTSRAKTAIDSERKWTVLMTDQPF